MIKKIKKLLIGFAALGIGLGVATNINFNHFDIANAGTTEDTPFPAASWKSNTSPTITNPWTGALRVIGITQWGHYAYYNSAIQIDGLQLWVMSENIVYSSDWISHQYGFYFAGSSNQNYAAKTYPCFAFKYNVSTTDSSGVGLFNIVNCHDVELDEGTTSLMCWKNSSLSGSATGLSSITDNLVKFKGESAIFGLRFTFQRLGSSGTGYGKYKVLIQTGGGQVF